MAEALLNHLGGDRFEAHSAGAFPAGYIHPLAIQTMSQMNIDISHKASKPIDIYLNDDWDIIITVCDNAKEACPILPGHKVNAHWGFEDPASYEGSEEEKREAFIRTAVEIEERIRLLLALEEHLMPHHEYANSVRQIGLN